MTSICKTALACLAGALLALPQTAGAQATTRNQDTYFTFSQPVELPNATLPAGRYLFLLADSQSNRHLVRVMSPDRQKLYTTLQAIPSYSLDRPSEDPQIRFMESPATGPNAIKVWFYPGNTVGHEFIYPRNQAMKLAKATGDSVLTTKSEKAVSAGQVADDELTRVNREGRDAEANMSGQRASANARAQTGTTEAEATATARDATAGATGTAGTNPASSRQSASGTAGATGTSGDDAATRRRTALPRTASLLPLIGLIGVASLVGSRMLRRARRD